MFNNKNMDLHKQKILIAVGGVLILTGAAVFLGGGIRKFTGNSGSDGDDYPFGMFNGGEDNNGGGDDTEKPAALPTVEGGSRTEVSQKIKTPEMNASSVPKDIAVPKNVVPSGGSLNSSFRQFDVKGDGGKYAPGTIVVDENDIVDVFFESVDADYDLYFPDFGIYKKIMKGGKAKIQFQPYPYGEYKFYCKDSCGGKDVSGKLIVNKKQS